MIEYFNGAQIGFTTPGQSGLESNANEDVFHTPQSTVAYFMLNPFYAYILNIHDLVWLDYMAYQPL